MTYSYSYPTNLQPAGTVNANNYDAYTTKQKKSSPIALGGAVVGGITGAVIGSKKNPNISKLGEVNENFAKAVFEKYTNTAKTSVLNLYNQSKEVLKEINKIKNVEDLKKLLNNNKDAVEELKASLDFDNINEKNMKDNIKVIKDSINSKLNALYQDMKNKIQNCWNKDKKCFEKADGVSDELLKIIKKTGNNKFKNIMKFGAIGALIAGVGTLLLSKLLMYTKKVPKQ